jgi:hypothetical protein
MVEAARREAWQHTAWLAALIANANRDPKRKPTPFTPDDFNPMVSRRERKAKGIAVDKENIGDMRAMFEGMTRRSTS